MTEYQTTRCQSLDVEPAKVLQCGTILAEATQCTEEYAIDLVLKGLESDSIAMRVRREQRAGHVLSSGNVMTSSAVKEHPPTVRINDTIRLRPRHYEARSKLAMHGSWWFVMAARQKGPRDPAPEWLLRSIAAQPRIASKKQVENLVIRKEFDPLYAIVAVVEHPKPFNYKEHADD